MHTGRLQSSWKNGTCHKQLWDWLLSLPKLNTLGTRCSPELLISGHCPPPILQGQPDPPSHHRSAPEEGRILATGILHPCSLQAVLLGFPPPVGKEANKASYEMTVHSPEGRRAGLHGDAAIYTCVNQHL